MILENNIGWCDETTNAVTGCDKVSPGCKGCYAATGTRARVLRALGIETWGPKGVRHPVNFEPVFRRLNKLRICDLCHETSPREKCHCGGPLRRIRLFADSNSDWLDDKWPIETLASFLKAIHDAPNVDVLCLTKRPENWESRLFQVLDLCNLDDFYLWLKGWKAKRSVPNNIWLGVSVEDQKRADERIPLLLQIPAKFRFLSVEPLLENVDLRSAFESFEHSESCDSDLCCLAGGVHDCAGVVVPGIDWLIVGGESGSSRRDCGVEAICDVAQQCVSAGVPCFVKQDCAFKPGQQGRIPDDVWRLKQFPK